MACFKWAFVAAWLPAGAVQVSVRQATHPLEVARAEQEGAYYWPTARGRAGFLGNAPMEGPRNLSAALVWKWQHPAGRYRTITLGTVIDDARNIYLSADDAIRKFSPDGDLLWTYAPQGSIPTNPALYNGVLYGSTKFTGQVFALSMETGKELWSVKVGNEVNGDTGFVGARAGVVVAASEHCKFCEETKNGNRVVNGLNATDGRRLWAFRSDANLWNFMPQFPDDSRVAFQDQEGRAYVLKLLTGELIWKAGGASGSFTDGTAILGNNGAFYTVNNLDSKFKPDNPGELHAYRLGDGQLLWAQRVPRAPNAFPAVGRLRPGANLSVVMPVGLQGGPNPTDVLAYDAESGELQWHWKGPVNDRPPWAGDLDGLRVRLMSGMKRQMCAPNTWGAPTIDASGRVFVGNQNGRFYGIQDLGGGRLEVDAFDAHSAFSSPGASFAPGLLAVASCDQLLVFRP